jgi:hypothetical protein
MTKLPLELRDGYKEDSDHPLVAALRELVRKQELMGAVLISFEVTKKSLRIGFTNSSPNRRFNLALQELADKVMVMIDEGDLDPSEEH